MRLIDEAQFGFEKLETAATEDEIAVAPSTRASVRRCDPAANRSLAPQAPRLGCLRVPKHRLRSTPGHNGIFYPVTPAARDCKPPLPRARGPSSAAPPRRPQPRRPRHAVQQRIGQERPRRRVGRQIGGDHAGGRQRGAAQQRQRASSARPHAVQFRHLPHQPRAPPGHQQPVERRRRNARLQPRRPATPRSAPARRRAHAALPAAPRAAAPVPLPDRSIGSSAAISAAPSGCAASQRRIAAFSAAISDAATAARSRSTLRSANSPRSSRQMPAPISPKPPTATASVSQPSVG